MALYGTSREAGEEIFRIVKRYVEKQGHTLHSLPKDFPLSRRTIYYIKDGVFSRNTLERINHIVSVKMIYQINER